MSATINTRTLGAVVDQRMVHAEQSIARLIAYGSDWSRLRVGFRLAINGTANISGAPNLALGLCSGVTKFTGDPCLISIPHFLGLYPWLDLDQNPAIAPFLTDIVFNYACPPCRYNIELWRPIKLVGSTKTQGAPLGGSDNEVSADPTAWASAVLLEYEKGTPNWTFRSCVPANSGGSSRYHVTLANLRQAVEDIDPFSDLPSVSLPFYRAESQSIAVDEDSDGALNAITAWWDRTDTPLELSGIVFKKWV